MTALDGNGVPLPDFKILELDLPEGGKVPGCPFCETPFAQHKGEVHPHECCVGQSYHMLRSQVVKIAEIADEKTAMKAFFALVEECL
jgi:hypothetical protein